ncbi:large protein [Human respirovirus 3]|uniref:RNA-directed RNA polymerase L n=3 Tax=Human respirovirus 3 TaxID=11216 RepID=O89238_9MONO|nr:large protein [Human respirovirus 3]
MISNQQSDNGQKENIKNLGAKRARKMDTESNNGTVSDILYPECHLNSPIVKGKIAQLHTIMSLPQPYDMDDDSILVITRQKIKLNKLDKRQRSIRRLKLILTEKVNDLGKYTFIRYPEMSKEMFKLYIPGINSKVTELLLKADRTYSQMTDGLRDLWINVLSKLASKNDGSNYDLNEEINNISKVHTTYKSDKWYNPFKTWFTIKYDMRRLQKARNEITFNVGKDYNLLEDQKNFLLIHPELVLILDKQNYNGYLITPELVLMYCDVVEGRWNISACAKLDPKLQSMYQKGNNLWEVIDKLFPIMGEKTFDVISLLEPLALSLIQTHDPVKQLRGAFLNHVLSEMELIFESGESIREFLSVDYIDKILDIFNESTIDEIAEIFSFFRTFGHPPLEASIAAEKVRKYMYIEKQLKFDTVNKCHAIFCTIIINGYRERHGGQWPPVTLPDHAHEFIINAYGSNSAISYENAVDYYQSFIGIKFNKFIEPQLDEDLTIYMKDKALSPKKSNWDTVYPASNLLYRTNASNESRRLVEVFIADSKFDPHQILDYVESGDWLDDPEFNISYSLKEKEIKQEGRLFAKMTYKMRATQVLSETLLANNIGKFFQENGMVKGEIELLKRLTTISISGVPRYNEVYNNSKSHTDDLKTYNKISNLNLSSNQKSKKFEFKSTDIYNDGYETVSCFLTTDLKKYCLNWRYESTALFGETCNQIFGLNKLFNWLHPRLEGSTIYVGDPYCPPSDKEHISLEDHPDSGFYVHNPRGGIEGFCQKLWTLISISAIHLAAVRIGVRVTAMVQGDNQAIAVTTRVPNNYDYRIKKEIVYKDVVRFFDSLREVMDDLGHELKLNETIISSKMFIYSKRIYYDGRILPQALKALSRCVFWSETVIDETRSASSNLATSFAKAIENGYSPVLGYACSIFKNIQQLYIALGMNINPTITQNIKDQYFKNSNWMQYASLIPASVGGFNYMAMSRCFVRNIGDPSVAALADIKRFIKANLLDRSVLYRIMNQEPGESSFLDWASDPYSCNLPQSQNITTMIKNITARNVLQDSPNPLLSGLFTNTMIEEDEELAEFLMDRKVILPRVAHDILDNSLTGIRNAIAGMLDTTKSLIRVGINRGGLTYSLLRKISNYDLVQYETLSRTLRLIVSDKIRYEDMCSVDLAIALRQKMWIHLSGGRMISGLETPDPLELLSGVVITGSEHCKICYSSDGTNPYTWMYLPGNIKIGSAETGVSSLRVPYFGSVTDERSEAQLGYIKNLSKPAKAAIRIAMIYTWAFGNDEISWMEASQIAQTRANFTLDSLKILTPVATSTNLSHRLKDTATQMKFSSTSLIRVSRFITMSNDNMSIKEANETKDTNLIYQQIMLTGLSVFEYLFRLKETTGHNPIVMHLHIEDECCIKESFNDEHINPESTLELIRYPESNEFIYDKDPLKDVDLSKLMVIKDHSYTIDMNYWDDTDIIHAISICTAITIADTMSQLDRDNLKEIIVIANDDDINSLITEFLTLDILVFLKTFGGLLVNQFAYTLYSLKIEGRDLIWDYIMRTLRDTSHSILKVLSNALSHPKVFKRFWDCGVLNPIYGPNTASQDQIKLALSICEYALDLFMREWLNGVSLEIYICDSDMEVANDRKQAFISRHLSFVCCLAEIASFGPNLLNLTYLERLDLLKQYLELNIKEDPTLKYVQISGLLIKSFPSTVTYVRKTAIKYLRIRGISPPEVIDDWDPIEDENMLDNIVKTINDNCNKDNKGNKINNFWGLALKNYQVLKIRSITSDSDDNDRLDASTSGLTLPQGGNYLSHQLRLFGINSTSCLKALELSQILMKEVNKDKDRLFLGEGAGAMLACYDATLGPAINYYNSGLNITDVIGQRELKIFPSEVSLVGKKLGNVTQILNRVKVLFNGNPNSTWIGNMECESLIWSELNDKSIGLVHCDMEGAIGKSEETVLHEHYSVIRITYLIGDDDVVLVSKIIPTITPNWSRILYLYKLYWKDVSIISLKTSNPASTELYLISKDAYCTIMEPSEVVLSKLKRLSLLEENNLLKWIILSKKRNNEWLHHEIKEGERDYGVMRPYHMALQIFGFQINLNHLAKEFLSTPDLTNINNIIQSFQRTIKDVLFEWINITHDDKRHKLGGRYNIFPLKNKGKLRLLSRRLVLSWISLSLSTRLLTGRFPDEKFEHRAQTGYVSLADTDLESLKLLSKNIIKNYRECIGSISYWFLTKEVKILMKLIGGAKLLGIPRQYKEPEEQLLENYNQHDEFDID